MVLVALLRLPMNLNINNYLTNLHANSFNLFISNYKIKFGIYNPNVLTFEVINRRLSHLHYLSTC